MDLIGGGSRIRTGDILLAKQTLYQLSYTPEGFVLLRGFADYGGHPPHWLAIRSRFNVS